MKMTLVERVDEIMIRAGQPMTVYSLAGAMREMFNERIDLGSLIGTLANEPSFVRTGFRVSMV
jgi:hypothetical protein